MGIRSVLYGTAHFERYNGKKLSKFYKLKYISNENEEYYMGYKNGTDHVDYFVVARNNDNIIYKTWWQHPEEKSRWMKAGYVDDEGIMHTDREANNKIKYVAKF